MWSNLSILEASPRLSKKFYRLQKLQTPTINEPTLKLFTKTLTAEIPWVEPKFLLLRRGYAPLRDHLMILTESPSGLCCKTPWQAIGKVGWVIREGSFPGNALDEEGAYRAYATDERRSRSRPSTEKGPAKRLTHFSDGLLV